MEIIFSGLAGAIALISIVLVFAFNAFIAIYIGRLVIIDIIRKYQSKKIERHFTQMPHNMDNDI